MANNEIFNKTNFFHDKYENKSKDKLFNFSEKFNYSFPKMKRLQRYYHIKDKFKNLDIIISQLETIEASFL